MDDMLEQLILGREVKLFSENEDTLPGKFQSQAGVFMRSTERRRKRKAAQGSDQQLGQRPGASDQYAHCKY